MMTTETPTPGPNAEGVRWDLTPLAASADDARALLDAGITRANAFQERYRGALETITAPELAEALFELAAIDNMISRAGSYAHLREATDITDTENRDLSAAIDRRMVEAGNALRFFELEWLALPEGRAEQLICAPELARDAHYLRTSRRFAPHMLTEPEERMLAEREPAAVGAWQTLFGRLTSTLEIDFDAGGGPEPHTIERLLSYVRDPNRDLRRRTLETLYSALEPQADTVAQVYDTLVGDRLATDRLRGYADPMDRTHLNNELDGEVVTRMMEAVEAHYGLAQRWFRAKAGILGLERLELWDQYAPIGTGREVTFLEGRDLVETAFGRFSGRIARVANDFFAEQRVDAEPRAGKRGGAFCAPCAQDAPAYVLMNFTDQMNDVMTLAHELGHGMHFTLSAERQTALSMHTGLAMAEVPSTFAELLTFDHLLETESHPATRRALVCERIEGSFATVFRQTVLARYEQRAYGARTGGATLTAERLSDIWIDANRAYYGDTIALPDGYGLGWSYIPHFISTRFYTYAYTFAHLVTLALYAQYRARGAEFADDYLEFLAAGGSAAPADLLRPLGVDLAAPDVWDAGFAEMTRMVEAAETD